MHPARRRVLCAALLACVPPSVVAADAPRTIQWKDLAPRTVPTGNPFEALTRDQLAVLSEVARLRDREAAGDATITAAEREAARANAKRLEQGGLDVDTLLAKRREMSEVRRTTGSILNMALEGERVRIPGYLLPLEITGKQVSEFLLVPWVGACIHTPPPPPNQIVHVKAASPYEMASMFEPVWVTGKLVTGAAKKSLYMVDGTSDIDIGYSIRGAQVEAYRR